MKHSLVKVASFTALFMLVGVGCKQSNSTDPKTNTTSSQTSTTATTFNLSAEALGNQQVSLKFNLPEADKKIAEGYRLMMGKNANPDMKNAGDWYILGKDHLEKVWSNRPIGTRHFRVCVMEKNTCAAYSNDVTVDIK